MIKFQRLRALFLCALALFFSADVFSQSNPGFAYGQVPTPGQWNSYFGAKQDYINPSTTGNVFTSNGTNWLSLPPAPAKNLAGGAANSIPYQTGANTTSFISQGTGLFQENAGAPSWLGFGVSVANPGTGTIEGLLPPQTITGASHVFATADFFKKTRRSNSGTAMTDTLPASTATGLINGTQIHLVNIDATASDTVTAGAGTTIGSGSTFVIGHGRDMWWTYDSANTAWRAEANTGTAMLGPNNFSDVASAPIARGNIGVHIVDPVVDYGADPTGTNYSTTAVQNAINYATSIGGKVVAVGTFKTSSQVTITCDADFSNAIFNVYGTPTIAVEVSTGNATNPTTPFISHNVWLPAINNMTKPGTGWAGQGIGVRVVNAYSSRVYFGTTNNFATSALITSYGGYGNVYNDYFMGWMENGQVNLQLNPGDSSSWVNENNFYGGRFSQNSAEGTNVTGVYHILLSPSATHAVNNNLFIKPSIEGNTPQYHVVNSGANNTLLQARWESAPPKVEYYAPDNTTEASGNIIDAGYNVDAIQFTYSTAGGGGLKNSMRGYNGDYRSTDGAIGIQNGASSSSPINLFYEAGTLPELAGANDWSYSNSAQFMYGKRKGDTYPRIEMDYVHGYLYLGDASGALTNFFSGTTSGFTQVSTSYFTPYVDNTTTLGSASYRWSTIYGMAGTFSTSATAPILAAGATSANNLITASGSGTFAGTAQIGISSVPTYTAAATSSGSDLYAGGILAAGSYTMGSRAGLTVADAVLGSGSAITQQYGVYIPDLTHGTSLNMGIRCLISSGSAKGCLYLDGTANNFLKGNTAFGSTTAPTHQVEVTGTLAVSGAVTLPGLASSSSATTGTLCWTTSTGNVTVDTTLSCLASAGRYKQNIIPLGDSLAEALALRPVEYELKPEFDPEHLGRQVGFIAEDVAEVDKRLVSFQDDGQTRGVRYMQMAAVLTKAIQEEQKEIEKQQIEIRELRTALCSIRYVKGICVRPAKIRRRRK